MTIEKHGAVQTRGFSAAWLHAWNSHDLELILSHYSEDVTLVSPTAIALLGDASGEVKGKAALEAYFRRGLAAYPLLRFQLLDELWGVASVVLYYVNQKGTKTAEFMQLDAAGQVTRVVAHYTRE